MFTQPKSNLCGFLRFITTTYESARARIAGDDRGGAYTYTDRRVDGDDSADPMRFSAAVKIGNVSRFAVRNDYF